MATLDILLLWRLTNANDCDGFFKMPNSVLQGHVIETITTTEKDCRAICRRNSTCYSINFRKKSQCDLNSETHFAFPGHFNPGGASDTYYAVVKPVTRCSNMFCSSGMVCKMRKGGKAYKCGKGQFIAHFPTILYKNGLGYHPLPLINVFSVSVWFKTNIVPGSQLQTIFSIFYPPNVDAFVIDLRDKQMRIESTGDTRDISSGELRDGNWHHVAFTWSAVNGAWKLYLNATLLDHGSDFSTGSSIASGYLVVGHEQDSYGGGFDSDVGFYGSMVGFSLWSRELSESEIARLALSWCAPLEGDLVKWSQLYPSYVLSLGGIQVEALTCE